MSTLTPRQQQAVDNIRATGYPGGIPARTLRPLIGRSLIALVEDGWVVVADVPEHDFEPGNGKDFYSDMCTRCGLHITQHQQED